MMLNEFEFVNATLPDIPRIYTALAEWLACMICIMRVKHRMKKWKFWCVSIFYFIILSLFLVTTNGQEGILWISCMAAAIASMFLFIKISCEISLVDAAYYCVRAFVIAEFAASIEWQTACYIGVNLGARGAVYQVICLLAVYGAVYFIIWILYRKFSEDIPGYEVTSRELVAYAIIGLAVFLVSNLGFVSTNTILGTQRTAEIFNARTLVDLGGVAIMYAYHVQRVDLRMRHELESVQNILHAQYVQYQQSQDAMDLINYKYHDLKHQIHAIRLEENKEKREEYLNQIEKELQSYEAQNRTGNKVLDTLLTSKNLACIKDRISITSVVDGKLLEFMDVMDICSVFGNALDNAIECERKITDPEKRLIHVETSLQRSFVIIRFENYCEGTLEFAENLPVTTKKDAGFHGYGLKSIRYTVHKYNGEVHISCEDGWFRLNILIPFRSGGQGDHGN